MICLTFDTDYMGSASMHEFLGRYNGIVPGRWTFFVHAEFPELYSTSHEISPHPFIEDLNRWDEELQRLAALLPKGSKGVRPHSCVFSHKIGVGLNALGYTYVSQAQNLYQNGLRPFRHPWGLWELPIYYMDNMDLWMVKNWPAANHVPFSRGIIENAVSNDASLFVFDMHPVHIALNTRTHEDYDSIKGIVMSDGVSPFDLRFPGRGVEVFFEELCSEMVRKNVKSVSCFEALQNFGCISR